VTADEIPDPQALWLRSWVNGVLKQESHTARQIFDVATTLSILSRGMSLEPGDIIATGTPSGVGFARKPPEFLGPGDVVECEVEEIGRLKNRIVQQ
jgi:2-keto-4-pentenoate hydratase/2-oxohepta-3-ene-1,7-dioic acid hydratase in catechol pathway